MALQLWALLLVWPRPTVGRSRWAAVLAVLAIMTKFTGVWGLLAAGWWLLHVDREQAAAFFRTALLTAVVTVGGFALISRGRFVVDIAALGAPQLFSRSAIGHLLPNLWGAARGTGAGTVAVIVAGAACAVVALFGRKASPFAAAWAIAALVLIPIFTDPGAWINHFLDVLTLGLVLIGWAVARLSVASVVRLVAEVAVLGVVAYGTVHVGRIGRSAITDGTTPATDAHPLAHLRPSGEILSENPYAPLSVGQLPVVLDPYMFVVMLKRHPSWQIDLVRRVRSHEFAVVLLSRPDPGDHWFDDYFGRAVMTAVEAAYRPDGMAGDQYVFVPR